MIKNIKDFTSKNFLKPEITGILITPDKIVATDSFKLIEITQKNPDIKTPIIIKLPKDTKGFESVALDNGKAIILATKTLTPMQVDIINGNFPDYQMIIPKEKPILTINLSAEHLASICEALTKKGTFNKMTLEFYAPNKPVKITNDNIMALLMPMND